MKTTDLTEIVERIGLTGYSHEEITMIYETMDELRPEIIVEWGTNVGTSARIFHEARNLLKLPCEVHSVEIQRELGEGWGHERGHHVKGLPVTLHVGDGVTTGVDLWHESGAERALFFLDDNHAEAEVLRQMRLIHIEAPQAVMLIHDTHYPVAVAGFTSWVLHEPGVAIQQFLQETGGYDYKEVLVGQTMVRLWPR